MTNTTTQRKSFPMPLWLQGIVEALAAAFIGAAIIVVPMAIMWLTGAFADMSLGEAGAIGALTWLSSYGVALEPLSLRPEEPLATCRVMPRRLFAMSIVLARRTRIRPARAAQWKNLWQPALGALADFQYSVWGTITLVNSETVNIH